MVIIFYLAGKQTAKQNGINLGDDHNLATYEV